jgi:hypothetical protein
LAQAKLIVTSEQRKGQDKVAVVDVAHESLIRHWWRLRDLLDNNREAIRTERKIQTAAEEWREKERRRDLLLRGLKLEEAKKFLQYGTDVLPVSSLAYEFVEASIQTSNNRRLTIGLLTGLIATILSGTRSMHSEMHEKQVSKL